MNEKNELRLLVVIINFRTPKLVCDALHSLDGQINICSDRVVVVDNSSNDGSINEINSFITAKNWNNWIQLIPSRVNGGFSAGNNLGIKSAKAKYYLLLNSDAFVRDKAIEIMIAKMESDPNVGIVGPRLEWESGGQQVSCFNDLTPWNVFLSAASTGVLTKLFRCFGIYEVAMPACSCSAKPEWISFACVLIRSNVIDNVGLMDEGYFMYREDNDYCRRARNGGWEILYWPYARVVHLNHGYSHNHKSRRLPTFYYQSRSRYFIKYYGRLGLFAANVLWVLGRSLSLLREFVERKQPAVHPDTWKDIWIGSLSKNDFDKQY